MQDGLEEYQVIPLELAVRTIHDPLFDVVDTAIATCDPALLTGKQAYK